MSVNPLAKPITPLPATQPLKRAREDSGLEETTAIFKKAKLDIHQEFAEINKIRSPYPLHNRIAPYGSFCLEQSVILSAMPDEPNLDPFLKMIYAHADAIIMLLQSQECSIKDSTPYFDDKALKTKSFSVLRKDPRPISKDIVGSLLEITELETMKSRKIPHYHCTTWPDGHSGSATAVAQLAQICLRANMPVIHCQAGVGRSGVLAATISAYRRIRKGNHSSDVIKQALVDLRKERNACVISPYQYSTIYRAVKILLCADGSIPPPAKKIPENKKNDV